MSSAQVSVTVYSRGKVVDGPFARPVRLTPDGRAGVVYGGEVYPLHTSNLVDLADPSYDKDVCDEFVQAGAKIPYAPKTTTGNRRLARSPKIVLESWNVEHNRYGNYLVFDADEVTAQATANLMAEVGLGVRSWDASWRPAADGKQYDWYIRLEFAGAEAEARQQIQQALDARSTARVDPAKPGADAIKELTETTLALSKELAKAKKRREHDRAEIDRLVAEAADAKHTRTKAGAFARSLEQRLVAAEATERRLRAQLDDEMQRREQAEATAQAVADTRRAPSSDEVAAALDVVQRQAAAHVAKANEERDTAFGLMDEEAKKTQELRSQLDELTLELAEAQTSLGDARSTIETLEGQLSEVESTAQERAAIARNSSIPRGVSAEAFVAALLPRLDLDRMGVRELLDFEAPRSVVELLLRFEKGEHVPASTFKGVRGGVKVMEVDEHFNIGSMARRGLGRVYYHDSGDNRRIVFVHRKDDDTSQNRAVQAFAERCRSERNRARAS